MKSEIFKTLRSFRIDRRTPNLNVGFIPYAPHVIALTEMTALPVTLDVN